MMTTPQHRGPVFRDGGRTAGTSARPPGARGIEPSDSVTEQCCGHNHLEKYCFWGERDHYCDAAGLPQIRCKA